MLYGAKKADTMIPIDEPINEPTIISKSHFKSTIWCYNFQTVHLIETVHEIFLKP